MNTRELSRGLKAICNRSIASANEPGVVLRLGIGVSDEWFVAYRDTSRSVPSRPDGNGFKPRMSCGWKRSPYFAFSAW